MGEWEVVLTDDRFESPPSGSGKALDGIPGEDETLIEAALVAGLIGSDMGVDVGGRPQPEGTKANTTTHTARMAIASQRIVSDVSLTVPRRAGNPAPFPDGDNPIAEAYAAG